MLRHCGEKLSVVVVRILPQIGGLGTGVVDSLAVEGVIDGSGVGEEDEMVDTIVLGLAHEPLLSVLTCPVVGAVGIEEALHTTGLIADVALLRTLRGTACADVHAPHRKADAQGIAQGVHFGAEQPLRSLLFLAFGEEVRDILRGPGVCGAKALDGLIGL